MYKLEGEDALKFNIIMSIDGNSSLKRVGEGVRGFHFLKDERTGRTDMWLSKEEVDEFKENGVLRSSLYLLLLLLSDSGNSGSSSCRSLFGDVFARTTGGGW